MNSFTIYGIYDPTNNLLKYIGKTTLKLNRRLSNHIYKAKSGISKSNLSKWILEIDKYGLKPVISSIAIYNCKSDIDWKQYEKQHILDSICNGYELLNHTMGGNGSHSKTVIGKNIIEMLGKVPDNRVAKIIGVSRKCISYYRDKLNIKPAPKKSYKYNPHLKGKPSPRRIKFDKKILDLIGNTPDTKVAKIAGVHVKTILRFRKRNNIKAFVPSGERHNMSKLTKNNVEKILYMHNKEKMSIKCLSEKFNVSYAAIWDIINKRSWKG